MKAFQPKWYSISPFTETEPKNVYHKEQQEIKVEGTAPKNLHVLGRADFWGVKTDGAYILRITADDYYKVYINGRFAGQGPAPAYPEHYYYNEILISPYIREGKNVIAVHLYYQGLINRVWNSGDDRFGVAAEIILADEKDEIAVPLRWRYEISKAYQGKTTGYETQFLENFDSRRWEENWNNLDYCDKNWAWMEEMKYPSWKLESKPAGMVSVIRREPAGVKRRADGSWLIDAGEEITGSIVLKAEGHKGQTVTILCGEELDEDGNVRYDMRCGCTYQETWTLDQGANTLVPYDYKGFRYVQLEMEAGVAIREIFFEVRHFPMNENLCTMKSSHPWLEKIFGICKNAVKYGTQEGYLDCPTREKGQYLGDAVVTSRAQVWLTGDTGLLEKCIEQFAQTQEVCPGLMGVAPGSFMQEIGDFSLLWSQMVMTLYQFSGNKERLFHYYGTAKGILKHFAGYEREDGLLCNVADKWNLVDWPENLRDQYDFELSRPVVAPGCHNVINALYIGAMKTAALMEQILELPCTFDWEKRRDAFIRTFYRKDKKLFADSEMSSHCALHSNLYPLYFGLVPKEAEHSVADLLVEKGLCCGVMLSYFVLKGLARAGRFNDVFQLLVNESRHGWVNMLREGATTCFEAWGKDQKWNTSLCHPWASAPVSILIEEIAGIVPAPETKEGFIFAPHIPSDVETFCMKVPFGGKILTVEKKGTKSVFYVLR